LETTALGLKKHRLN